MASVVAARGRPIVLADKEEAAVADAAAAEVVEAFDVVGCRRASWAGAFLTILPILSSVVLIRAWRS